MLSDHFPCEPISYIDAVTLAEFRPQNKILEIKRIEVGYTQNNLVHTYDDVIWGWEQMSNFYTLLLQLPSTHFFIWERGRVHD